MNNNKKGATALLEKYYSLSHYEQQVIRNASSDENMARSISLCRLYFPEAKDIDLVRFLGEMRRIQARDVG